MKSGFVITDSDIELPLYTNWVLNVGIESEITDEKYIFHKYSEDTDFLGIANKIREERLDSYCDDGVKVEVKKKVTIKEKEFKRLPVPENQEELKDVGLLMCAFFNDDNARFDAMEKGLEQLRRLNPMPHIVFYEAGNKPRLEHLFNENDTYKFIQTTEKNEMLWQKEALFNLMAKENNFKYYIFHDPDIYPQESDWALWVKKYLEKNEVVLQNGYIVIDTVVENRSRHMYAYKATQTKEFVAASPGGSIALSKKFFSELKGWPIFFIAGGGDGAGIHKWAKESRYQNSLLESCPWWKNAAEKERIGLADYSFAPYELIHFYHGEYKERGYFWRDILLGWLGINDIENHVSLGSNGLLEWHNKRKDIIYVLRNKNRLFDREEALDVFKEAVLNE